MSAKQIIVTYKRAFKDAPLVHIALEDVWKSDSTVDPPLKPEVAKIFIDAAAEGGAPPAERSVTAYVETFPGDQPWPVFVVVGGDILAEFYPEEIKGKP